MFCTNCGKQIEDNSNFCTGCGNKIQSDKLIPLTITREKKMVGVAISFTVYVDGKDVGKLKNDTSITCNVPVGKHQVIIKSFEKDTVQNIEVSESTNSVEIIITVKMGLISGKAGIKEVKFN